MRVVDDLTFLDIETTIMFYINHSKIPYVRIIENSIYYDEYCNHTRKAFRTCYTYNQIKFVLLRSKKLYSILYKDGSFIVGINNGTGNILYNRRESDKGKLLRALHRQKFGSLHRLIIFII